MVFHDTMVIWCIYIYIYHLQSADQAQPLLFFLGLDLECFRPRWAMDDAVNEPNIIRIYLNHTNSKNASVASYHYLVMHHQYIFWCS